MVPHALLRDLAAKQLKKWQRISTKRKKIVHLEKEKERKPFHIGLLFKEGSDL
jgi:hypothetical protein